MGFLVFLDLGWQSYQGLFSWAHCSMLQDIQPLSPSEPGTSCELPVCGMGHCFCLALPNLVMPARFSSWHRERRVKSGGGAA